MIGCRNHVTEILSFDWLFSIFGFSTKVIKTRNSCTRSSFLPRNHEEEEGENQGKQGAEGRSDLTGRPHRALLEGGAVEPADESSLGGVHLGHPGAHPAAHPGPVHGVGRRHEARPHNAALHRARRQGRPRPQ